VPSEARTHWKTFVTEHGNARLAERVVRPGLVGSWSAAKVWLLRTVTDALDAGMVGDTPPAFLFGRGLPDQSQSWIATAIGDRPVAILLRGVNTTRRRCSVVTVIVHGLDDEQQGI
jgi:hypothetical protein